VDKAGEFVSLILEVRFEETSSALQAFALKLFHAVNGTWTSNIRRMCLKGWLTNLLGAKLHMLHSFLGLNNQPRWCGLLQLLHQDKSSPGSIIKYGEIHQQRSLFPRKDFIKLVTMWLTFRHHRLLKAEHPPNTGGWFFLIANHDGEMFKQTKYFQVVMLGESEYATTD